MAYPLQAFSQPDYVRARRNMVNGQLLTNGVHNRALVETYLETPRERFVDEALGPLAYLDEDVRIQGTNRYLLEPLVEARMLQYALEGVCGTALVLGAASLPTVEMVAAFTRHVTVLEPERKFASGAEARLDRGNVTVVETAYREGYPRGAPYDVIIATGALASIPSTIANQLAVGGRMVAVIRPNPAGAGKISVLRRLSEDSFETISLDDASTPYLPGFTPETVFRF